MNPRIRHLAAVLAAAATPLALAQAGPAADNSGAPTPVQSHPTLAEQAMFSITAGTRSPNAEVANTIVQALAADPSLKGSKITVQPEEDKILLTGVTRTLAQQARASAIAAQHAGDGKVVNVTVAEEVFLEVQPSGLAGLSPTA